MDTPDRQQIQTGPALANVQELQPQPVRMTGQLVLKEAFPEDAGVYTCIAENMYGEAQLIGNINVVTKREWNYER